MTISSLRDLALSFPGTTEEVKWGHDLCFLVADKMFLVLGPDKLPVSASFKTTAELFEELSARSGFMPAPYLAGNKWVQVIDIGLLPPRDWQEHARRSYDLVVAKLPKKLRERLR